MSRYPFTAYPNSWYFVGWSDSLAAGELRSLRYFGEELIAFRTRTGQAAVLDAYCPHLGAHIGRGGTVHGECVTCPFHHWRFDRDGACTSIPYADRVPPKARLRSWPVRERNGMLMVYYHAEGREPEFEPPDLEPYRSPRWSRPLRFGYKVRSHVQELTENTFDSGHFLCLHKYAALPELDVEYDGPVARLRQTAISRLLGIEVEGTVEMNLYGAGLHTTSMEDSDKISFCLMSVKTPIDEERVEMGFSLVVRRKSRLLDPIMKQVIAARIRHEVEKDIPIWESKRYMARPVLCEGDGPIMRFRRWHQQFLSEPSTARE